MRATSSPRVLVFRFALLGAVAAWLGILPEQGAGGRLPAAASTSGAPPAGVGEDPDRAERLEDGRRSFVNNCLMCHGEEMTARLRLTSQQWAAELDKMIGWGAPVPPEEKGLLLEYLQGRFAEGTPPAPPDRMTPEHALASVLPAESSREFRGDPDRGSVLYAANCATCHGPEALGAELGTCLVEKPVLLRPAEYSEVVRKGRRRMPGFETALTPAQEADILAWLRARRYDPGRP